MVKPSARTQSFVLKVTAPREPANERQFSQFVSELNAQFVKISSRFGRLPALESDFDPDDFVHRDELADALDALDNETVTTSEGEEDNEKGPKKKKTSRRQRRAAEAAADAMSAAIPTVGPPAVADAGSVGTTTNPVMFSLSDHTHAGINPTDAQTITGLKTFDRDPSAPFAVTASSAKVDNLDADKLDGFDASAFAAAGAVSGVANQVAYFTSVSAVGGEAAFTYDPTTDTLVVGVVGTSSTLNVGQGTTGTDVGTIRVRSGNSGTTSARFLFSRSTTDFMQIATDGTDSFYDYTGTITWRNSIGGNQRMKLTSNGVFTLTHTAAKCGVGITPSARIQALEQTLGDELFRLETLATNDDPNYYVKQMRAATTNATATAMYTFPIAASKSYLVEARVVARRTGGTAGTADDGAAYIRRALVTTKAGTVTINAVQDGLTQEDQAAWDCTFDVSTTNIRVLVTGEVDNNVTWHGTLIVQDLGT